MKTFQTFLLACGALFIFGCGAANTTNTNGAANTAAAPSGANPSDTLRAFLDASKKKDVAAVKKTLSKGSLDLLEKTAQAQSATVDELLQRDNSAMLDDAPEISNERIETDSATVDVKLKNAASDTIPFVKEDGAWKIAFDKYQQAAIEKMRQEMNAPAANAPAAPSANKK